MLHGFSVEGFEGRYGGQPAAVRQFGQREPADALIVSGERQLDEGSRGFLSRFEGDVEHAATPRSRFPIGVGRAHPDRAMLFPHLGYGIRKLNRGLRFGKGNEEVLRQHRLRPGTIDRSHHQGVDPLFVARGCGFRHIEGKGGLAGFVHLRCRIPGIGYLLVVQSRQPRFDRAEDPFRLSEGRRRPDLTVIIRTGTQTGPGLDHPLGRFKFLPVEKHLVLRILRRPAAVTLSPEFDGKRLSRHHRGTPFDELEIEGRFDVVADAELTAVGFPIDFRNQPIEAGQLRIL